MKKILDKVLSAASWFFAGAVWFSPFDQSKNYMAVAIGLLCLRIVVSWGFNNEED